MVSPLKEVIGALEAAAQLAKRKELEQQAREEAREAFAREQEAKRQEELRQEREKAEKEALKKLQRAARIKYRKVGLDFAEEA